MKKRIMSVLLGLLICISITGCAGTSTKSSNEVKYSSLDVIMMMFDKVGVDPYETINILDEKTAKQQLNYENMQKPNQEEINIEGYVSGANTAPMMMPSTQNITVLQFEDNSKFEEYKEALKGIMYSAVCVIPSEESIHVIENGNFICYISVEGEDDKGNEFEKAFKELDLTVEPQYNDDTTLDKALTIYNQYKENYNIAELMKDDMPTYTINPDIDGTVEYDFTKEDLEDGYFVRSKIDYSQMDEPTPFSAYVIKVKNPDKIDLVKEAVENASKAEGFDNKFFISKDVQAEVKIDGNYIILTAKKDK